MKGRVEQNSGSYKRLRLYSWLQSCVVALLVTAAVFVLWFQSCLLYTSDAADE